MLSIQPFLKSLISASGLSGHETPVRQLIAEAWQPLTSEMRVSPMGSLEALVGGTGPEPRPSIMLAAHMDAIGLMAAGLVDGLIRFTDVGGIDDRILPGQPVCVHGREDLPGVVVQPPAHLLPPQFQGQTVPQEYLYVDIGLEPEQVSRLVRVGDLISFAQPPVELSGGTLAGHSLDDRAAVAAVTACLQELQTRVCAWDVWAVATTQEEVGAKGAGTSAFGLHPDLAVAIDVTFAKGPGSTEAGTFPLGQGLTLGWGGNIHPGLFGAFKDTAEDLEIPYQLEAMPDHSGTDAYTIQVSGQGIPCMVLGIPLRYMHTPVEVVSLKDIQRTGRLLAEFIRRLPPDVDQMLSWDPGLEKDSGSPAE